MVTPVAIIGDGPLFSLHFSTAVAGLCYQSVDYFARGYA